jgi:diacylglycerol kinase family enzyme
MIVILNPKSGGGAAMARWKRIESRVRELVGPFTLFIAEDTAAAEARVATALRAGETEFVAAGGDGTVNLIMASIVEAAPAGALANVKLGAIGLGSSNDFHKPISRRKQIDGVPLKLDFHSTVRHDVGLLTYRDVAGALRSRRWLINASIGTTAQANRFFNHPSGTLRLLKRLFPSWAMAYAALRTILGYRSLEMQITLDGGATVRARVKNLGIVKNPHFTGALRYDSPYEPGSGDFYVHLLKGVSLPRLALTLLGLVRGRFSGREWTRSWRARRLRVQADRPFDIEGDGEAVTASRADFSLMPGLLQVCT